MENPETWNDDVKAIVAIMSAHAKSDVIGGSVMVEIEQKMVHPLRERIAALEAQLALLANPHAVHTNILRGTLPLTKAQAIHIAGLPADIEAQVKTLRVALTILRATMICQNYRRHMEMVDAALAATEPKP